jgi:hypothetical protein
MDKNPEQGKNKSKRSYRKKTKPVSSGQTKTQNSVIYGKEYLEKKKLEIPMYDPYTGEPNPHYEELTGKKNPLLDKPENRIESTKKGDNHKSTSLKYGKDYVLPEFGRKNRFLLMLPKEFNIEPFFVSSVSGPNIIYDNVRILGIKTCLKKYYVEDVHISFNVPVSNQIMKKLYDTTVKNKKFCFSVEIIDPTGVVYENWDFNGCSIKEIHFDDLSYDNDGIMKTNLRISVGQYTIK